MRAARFAAGAPVPFVGRRAEVAALEAVLSRLDSGRGGMVVVTGGAGIGKSRLVSVTLEAQFDRRPDVCVGFGACLPDLLMPPLWPVHRAVSSAVAASGPEPSDSSLGHLAALLRPQPGGTATTGGTVPPGWDRLAVLGDIVDGVVVAVEARPLVLVIEDVHWADAETLALVRLLAPELTRIPLVVVLTARSAWDEDPPSGLAWLSGSAWAEVVALGPLTLSDIDDYLAQGGQQADPAAVLASSGGLPLLLPAAVGAGGRADEASRVDVPALVRRLTVSLRDEHVRVLEAASLAASDLDVEVAAAAAGVDTALAGEAFAAALRAGLLVRPANGRGVSFAHELVRETLTARLTPDRARAAHLRIAQLGSTRVGVPAVRVAAHWEEAGPDPQSAAHAATWWARAAEEAAALLAHGDAAGHQDRAAVAAVRAKLPPAEVAQFHLGAARAWYRAGRYAEAVASAEEASALAASAQRRDLMAEAALAVGWVAFPEAQAAIGRLTEVALDGGAPLADATRARLVAQQVAALGNYAEARGATLAAKAMSLARRSGDVTALLEAIGAWISASPEVGSAAQQRELAEEAILAASTSAHQVPELMARTWRLNSVVQLGRVDLAGEELEAIRMIVQESRLPLATWHWLRARVAMAVLRGDFGVIDDLHRQATAIACDSGDVVAANVGEAAVFETARRRGVPPADPERELSRMPNTPASALIEAPRALVLEEIGRHDEAHAVYRRLLPLLDAHTEYRPWWPVLYMLLDLAERFGDHEVGPKLVREVEPYARGAVGGLGTSTVWFIGNPNRHLGRALVLAGRLEEAVGAYRTAMACDERMGAVPDVTLGRLDLASLLARDDWPGPDRSAARRSALDEAERAARDARALDMPGHAERAEALVQRVTAALAADDPLSPREREVADLVVAGFTNHAIADRLFLSERTVESHVRSVLMKLGCRNRAELIRREHSR